VRLTRRQPFTSSKFPGTHFCWRLSRPQGYNAAGRVRSIKKSNDHIGNQTRDLPACSIVLQPTTLPRSPLIGDIRYINSDIFIRKRFKSIFVCVIVWRLTKRETRYSCGCCITKFRSHLTTELQGSEVSFSGNFY
jgi:hypothetical protein